MHNELGSWVTLPCHIHLGGALKMIIIKYMHSSPSKVNDHIRIGKIYHQTGISVAYDQTHDHQCLTGNCIVSQPKSNKDQIKQERTKATLSLEAYDLYIFLPL